MLAVHDGQILKTTESRDAPSQWVRLTPLYKGKTCKEFGSDVHFLKTGTTE